jgi:hypothetical protein
MANCLLEQSGHASHKCTPTMAVRDCTISMDDRAFSVYSSFYTNIHRWGQASMAHEISTHIVLYISASCFLNRLYICS